MEYIKKYSNKNSRSKNVQDENSVRQTLQNKFSEFEDSVIETTHKEIQKETHREQ